MKKAQARGFGDAFWQRSLQPIESTADYIRGYNAGVEELRVERLAWVAAQASAWANTPDETPYAEGFRFGYLGRALKTQLATWAADRHAPLAAGHADGIAARPA